MEIKQPIKKGVAKTPVVMQLEMLECGAACLTMILAYYDKWIPLEQVRFDCGVSRDGSNAKNMLKAARNYGLEASGYKFEPESLREDAEFPCIIHWNFNHFVVLKGFKGDYAYLNDPGRGEVKVPMKEFDESFTGITLMFRPGPDFKPSGKQKTTLDYVKTRITGTKVAVAFVVLTTIITSLLGIIQPGFTRILYDRLLNGRNIEWIPTFIAAFTIFSLIQIIMSWLTVVYSLKINGKMAAVGSTSFMWKVLRLPLEFFTQRMAGDILSREGSNASIANTIVNTLAPLVINAAMMIFYFVVMIRYNAVLTFVALASTLINFLMSRYISKKRMNATRVSMRDSGKLAGTTVAGIEMIETIKASGSENGFFTKWAGYQAGSIAGNVDYSNTNYYLGIIPSIVSTIASSVILAIGLYYTIQGNFTLGMITAFQGYLSSFLGPVTSLITASQTLQEMRTEMERIDDVMEYPIDFVFDDTDDIKEDSYKKLTGDIEMKDVVFGYSRLSDPLIKGFSMTLKQGQSVALVGSSGCGKSTISKLLSGLAEPWSGEILFDGKSIKQIDRAVFTGSLAVVDQDIIIFEDTIKNNIKMWDDSIQDFEVIMAARDAQIHEDIMKRKEGYDYVMSEGGKDFSGGQRQRMEIARVLAQDPTICILDEATSALDAKTEFDVVKAIKDRGITCVIIAHRLSTIRDCDEIIVLDHGDVVERGTHEELMKLKGRYTQLVTSE